MVHIPGQEQAYPVACEVLGSELSMRAALMSMKGIVSASRMTAVVPVGAAARTRARTPSALAKKRPDSMRSTTTPGTGLAPGWRSRSSNLSSGAVWPSSATCGLEARYSSRVSDAPMPMKRPGKVSKTITPSMAVTAARKSGRAATP